MSLPSGGFDGEAPEFPMPRASRYEWEIEGTVKRKVYSAELTEEFRTRELEVWDQLWQTPQAAAWARESWRWQTIAEFCRLKTIVEKEPDANASLVAQMHRFRDQIGLTPAGLRENGWAIAADELGEKRTEKTGEPAPAPVRRLRVVNDGA